MNLLAHAYLSFNQPALLVGNMISDYVKGKQRYSYPEPIQQGIMLHRAIDTFTDNHPATHEAKQHFRPQYRLYAGAFIDVVYDHFLANDQKEFNDTSVLNFFAQSTYQSLQQQTVWLPEPFLKMLPYMQSQNWLYHYKDLFGIEKSFGGLVRRAAYLEESAVAFEIFQREYNHLQSCYAAFFPAVKQMAIDWLEATDAVK